MSRRGEDCNGGEGRDVGSSGDRNKGHIEGEEERDGVNSKDRNKFRGEEEVGHNVVRNKGHNWVRRSHSLRTGPRRRRRPR